MEKIVLDTNVLIEILKGNQNTIKKIHSLKANFYISAISIMELFYGALNKQELKKIEQFVALFNKIEIDEEISKQATTLIKTYAKSHALDIPDSIIAATALSKNAILFTYNIKDFRYIKNITLLQ